MNVGCCTYTQPFRQTTIAVGLGSSDCNLRASRAGYFLRRLSIARAAKPTNRPAMIDSSGKPGIGGSAKGVETELVVAGIVVVAVFWTVIVVPGVLAVVA